MCLISKWRFPKKAKGDIICYKVLYKRAGTYYAPFNGDVVNINKDYVAEGNSISLWYNYQKGVGYIHTLDFIPPKFYVRDYFGIGKYVIFKCIIPKGVKYHCNINNNMYCSKKILFVEEIEKFTIYE